MLNAWKNLRHLPRPLWRLALAILINRAGAMVLPFLAIYLTQRRQYTAAEAGTVLAYYGIGALAASMLGGYCADHFGKKRTMLFSLIGTAAILLLFPFFKGHHAIMALVAVWALISELFRPASLALVGDLVPETQRKSGFALMRLAINLGMSCGPALGGFLTRVSYNALFVIDALTALAGAYILWQSSLPDVHVERTEKAEKSNLGDKAPWRNRRFRLIAWVTFPTAIIFFQHDCTIPIFLVNMIGLQPYHFGLLASVNTVMILFLEVPLNSLTNHWSARRSLVVSSFFWGFGFGGFMFVHNFTAAAICVAIWTFGEMIGFPASAAYLSAIAPPGKSGSYMGNYAVVVSSGLIVAPWIGGHILQDFGGTALWSTTLLLGFVAAAISWRIPEAKATIGTGTVPT